MTIGKFLAVVIDCANPLGMSSFWQQLLGGQIDPNTSSQEWMSLSGVPGLGYLGFQKVPESKSIKNRVHIDDAVQRAIALGAEKSGEIVEEETNYFQVMLDPEKNEFCFILRKGNT